MATETRLESLVSKETGSRLGGGGIARLAGTLKGAYQGASAKCSTAVLSAAYKSMAYAPFAPQVANLCAALISLYLR